MFIVQTPALLNSLKLSMQLLLFSLFLVKTVSPKSYLVKTKDGKTYLSLGNPKDFTDGDSYWMNTSKEIDTSDIKSEYYPRQLFSMKDDCLLNGWL